MNDPLEQLRTRFRDDLRFIRGWIRKPGEVGAVSPTGRLVANAMASFVRLDSDLPVLELGPGTGTITSALLARGIPADRIVGIEYSADFCTYLRERFPGVNLIHGDAFRVADLLEGSGWSRFRAVIGAIPLLNVPKPARGELIGACLDMTEPGGPFVQITYGPKPPAPAVPGRYSVQATDWLVKNIPPARLFVYRADGAKGNGP